MQEVGDHPVVQQDQCAVALTGREEVAGGTPGIADGLEPFGRAQLELAFAGRVPGAQLGTQQLADQMVVAEAGPLIIQRHQEQVGQVDAAQPRRGVLPAADGRTGVRGQLAQEGRVQHEPGHLGWLLLQHLGDEVLGDGVAADLKGSRRPGRVAGAAQGQRGHLQRRGPSLAAFMQPFKVGRADLDAEVREQVAAFGQREMQVTVPKLAQLAGQPKPVQPQRRVSPTGQHQLSSMRRPVLHQIGHGLGDRGGGVVKVVHDDRRPGGQLGGIVRNGRRKVR